jgi:hypothetical protein
VISTTRQSRAWPALLGALALVAAGCGANNAASKLRDEAPTVDGAMHDDHGGGSCTGVDKPLVVDADESLRGDIEVAMTKGIAIVAYDCKQIRLLACKATGDYSFTGFTTQQKTIQLNNADEIKANLPLSGAAMAAKLEGEMSKGVTLDIAMALIGKRASTAEVTSAALTGPDCKDATHFVRGATLGAFAMQTGSKAQLKATAEMFTVKAGAESSSGLKIDKKQGVLEECLKATPDDAKPRAGCTGIIRLELVVLGKHAQHAAGAGEGAESTDAAKNADPTAETHECPGSLRWLDGKCGVASGTQAHACKEGDFTDCTAQCDAGNGDSCNTLGVIYQRGAGKDVPQSYPKAEAAFLKACGKNRAAACGNLANLYGWGPSGVTKSIDNFKKFAQQGCNMGDGKSCSQLAAFYFRSTVADEPAKSGPLYARACSSGDANGCYQLGFKLNSTERDHFGKSFIEHNPAGIVWLGKACKAGLDYACSSTGDAYAGGIGVERDGLKALELYGIACDRNSPIGCYRAGHLYEHGILTKDEKKAADFYKKSCEMKTADGTKPMYGSAKGCIYLGRLLERGAGVTKDEVAAAAFYRKSCDPDEKTGGVDGCVDLARIYEAGKGVPKNPAKAADLLAYGCNNFSSPSCALLAGRYLTGTGLPKDEKKDDKKAADAYKRACGTSPEGCVALASLSLTGKGGLSKADKDVSNLYVRSCGLAVNHDADIDGSAAVGQLCAKAAAAEVAGKGIDKNPTRALEHFTRACDRGDKPSCDQAKKLAAAAPPPAKH